MKVEIRIKYNWRFRTLIEQELLDYLCIDIVRVGSVVELGKFLPSAAKNCRQPLNRIRLWDSQGYPSPEPS